MVSGDAVVQVRPQEQQAGGALPNFRPASYLPGHDMASVPMPRFANEALLAIVTSIYAFGSAEAVWPQTVRSSGR
jgi:hypothetical protein